MGAFSVEGMLELSENLSIMSLPLMLMSSEKHEINTNGVYTVLKGGMPFAPTVRYTEVKILD